MPTRKNNRRQIGDDVKQLIRELLGQDFVERSQDQDSQAQPDTPAAEVGRLLRHAGTAFGKGEVVRQQEVSRLETFLASKKDSLPPDLVNRVERTISLLKSNLNRPLEEINQLLRLSLSGTRLPGPTLESLADPRYVEVLRAAARVANESDDPTQVEYALELLGSFGNLARLPKQILEQQTGLRSKDLMHANRLLRGARSAWRKGPAEREQYATSIEEFVGSAGDNLTPEIESRLRNAISLLRSPLNQRSADLQRTLEAMRAGAQIPEEQLQSLLQQDYTALLRSAGQTILESPDPTQVEYARDLLGRFGRLGRLPGQIIEQHTKMRAADMMRATELLRGARSVWQRSPAEREQYAATLEGFIGSAGENLTPEVASRIRNTISLLRSPLNQRAADLQRTLGAMRAGAKLSDEQIRDILGQDYTTLLSAAGQTILESKDPTQVEYAEEVVRRFGGLPKLREQIFKRYTELSLAPTRAMAEQIRRDLRVDRQQVRLGGELSPERLEEISAQIGELKESVLTQTEEFQRLRETDPNDPRLQGLSMEISTKGSLIQELEAVLEEHARTHASHLNLTMGVIIKALGALAIGSIASKLIIQDPLRYRTMPAINALGNQGELGGLLSRGLAAQAQYDADLNQRGMNISFGLAALMALRGGIPGALLGGAVAIGGMAAANAELFSGLAKQTGLFQDDLVSVYAAQELLNPERLLRNFDASRVGLLALGARGNLGYQTGLAATGTRTGNVVLDWLMYTPFTRSGITLAQLGYDPDRAGALLSNAAIATMGRSGLEQTASYAALISDVSGQDPAEVLGAINLAERYGSMAPVESLLRARRVFADESGNVTAYAQNVFVPALLQVAESLGIRNVAKSSEELERQVFGLANALRQGGGRLGQLAESNPEILRSIANMMDRSIKSIIYDPVMFTWMSSLGASPYDIMTGNPEVLSLAAGALLRTGFAQDYLRRTGGADFASREFLSTHSGMRFAESARMLLGVDDPMTALALLDTYRKAGTFVLADFETRRDSLEEKALEIVSSEFGQLRSQVAEQVSLMLRSSTAVFEQMRSLQQKLTEYFTDEKLLDIVNKAQEQIEEVLKRAGSQPSSGISDVVEDAARSIIDLSPSMGVARALRGDTENVSDLDQEIMQSALARVGLQTDSVIRETVLSLMESPAFRTDELGQRLLGAGDVETFRVLKAALGEGIMEVVSSDPVTYHPSQLYDDKLSQLWFGGWRSVLEEYLEDVGGFSRGGFTGPGTRLNIAGIVHAGEYVISDTYASVPETRAILDRIQAGENVARTLNTGDSVYLTMRIRGKSVEDIERIAYSAAERYARFNRLHLP